jgi:hypothetical protein
MNAEKRKSLLEKVKKALDKLKNKDEYLLEKNHSERCIAHRLAIYLEEQFNYEYDVDCEYNRELDNSKRVELDDEDKLVYPDIIVHKRGTNQNNLLILEIKKSNNDQSKGRNKDKSKLEQYTSKSKSLKYKLGIFIDIEVGEKIKRSYEIELFENGKKSLLNSTNPV